MLKVWPALIAFLSLGTAAMFCQPADPTPSDTGSAQSAVTEDAEDTVSEEETEEEAMLPNQVDPDVAEDFLQDLYPTVERYWDECAQFILIQGGRDLETAYLMMRRDDVRYMPGVGYFIVDTFLPDSPALWYGKWNDEGKLETWVVNWPIPLNRCGG